MDEDRYYNLGSHDKLFNQIDELTDALAIRDAEIESMRQQLADMTEAYAKVTERIHMVGGYRDQLADHIKREALMRDVLEYHQAQTRPIHRTEEALASTADLDGLILCHAEPVFIRRDQLLKARVAPFLCRLDPIKHEGEGFVPLFSAWEPK